MVQTQFDKARRSENRAAAQSAPKQSKPAGQFQDNRPETIAQRQLHQAVDNTHFQAFNEMAAFAARALPGSINEAKVAQRRPADFVPYLDPIYSHTAFMGKNVWDTLYLAIKKYVSLDETEYFSRYEQLQIMENASRPCSEDASKWQQDKKMNAITQLAHFLDRVYIEKGQVNQAIKGKLDLQGQLAPVANDPAATTMAEAATITQGEDVFDNKELIGQAHKAKLVLDKTPMQGALSTFPVIDCFVLEKTLTACKIAYWEKKIYTQPDKELIETKVDRVDGWVNKNACDIDNLMGNTVVDLLGAASADRADQPLFPQRPSIKDIVQVGLADCYLLAPIAGFVDKNPGIIENMMKDNGNGTVTVRFYDITSNGMQGRNYTPRFITINKSIVQVNGKNVYAGGALWVQLIEKAFAAAGYTGKTNALDLPKSALVPSYGEIEFGKAEIAMEHILGKPARVTETNTKGGSIPQHIATRLPWSKAEIQEHNLHKASLNKPKDYQTLTMFGILKGDIGAIDEWFSFLGKLNKPLDSLVQDLAQKGASVNNYQAEIRLEDFGSFFHTNKLSLPVVKNLMSWLVANQIYPGKRGTSIYSNSQMEIFQDIVQKLTTNNIVALSTRIQVGRAPTGIGSSGGEEMTKGLAGKHVYTVLDFGYGPGKSKIQLSGPQKWLKIRNPWGQYERKYVKNKAIETWGGSGEFWLELSDVTKRFKSFSSIDL